jgi:hypothetical protein
MPIRGALVYMPIPLVKDGAGKPVVATENYIPPSLSGDSKRLYVGFNTVFIAYLSSAPIATPRAGDILQRSTWDRQQFFRIYGGPERDTQTEPNSYIQFAVAVQTASPRDFPGATLAEQFQHFTQAMDLLALPQMTTVDTLHPIWQFANGQVTLSNTYQGDRYHGGNDGKGDDWIGGPNNESPVKVDYANWPQLQQDLVASSTRTVSQPQKGNLTIRYPGTETTVYDLTTQSDTTFLLPVAVDDTVSTSPGVAVSGNVLSNDHSPNAGLLLQAIQVEAPAHGTVVLDDDGTFTYTPTEGFIGTDRVTYRADDTMAASPVATLTITVTDKSSPGTPGAGGDSTSGKGSGGGGSGGGCGLGSGMALAGLCGVLALRMRRSGSRQRAGTAR